MYQASLQIKWLMAKINTFSKKRTFKSFNTLIHSLDKLPKVMKHVLPKFTLSREEKKKWLPRFVVIKERQAWRKFACLNGQRTGKQNKLVQMSNLRTLKPNKSRRAFTLQICSSVFPFFQSMQSYIVWSFSTSWQMLLSSDVDLIVNSLNSYSASEFFTNRDQNLFAHLITTQWSSLHIIKLILLTYN